MHPQAEAIISDLDTTVYESVARQIVGDDSASLVDEPRWTEIHAAHTDLRTVAILRVEGSARLGTDVHTWSSVQKFIDTTADVKFDVVGAWIDPKLEQAVYEHALFKDSGLRFRPADCYLVSEPKPGIKVFWLEDLAGAEQAPFSVGQLDTILRNLGEFNGYQASRQQTYPLDLARDGYLTRWSLEGHPARIDRLPELLDRPEIRTAFRNTSIETTRTLHDLLDRLNRQSRELDHSLSFGDCNAGNLFSLGNETIAIDWASLTIDPTGVDAGCLIGSAIIWGRSGDEVLRAEKDLFASYLSGLRAGGWAGDEKHVRQAFLGQFGTYLMLSGPGIVGAIDADTEVIEHLRNFVETRFATPFDEIPELLTPIVDSYPGYIDEVLRLVALN